MFRQGEVWWAEAPDPIGSELGWRRPVIVVQADPFNRGGLRTVMCAMVTTNLALSRAPGNVRIHRGAGGLPMESVANVTQVMTLDRSRLAEKLGRLPDSLLARVLQGVALVLGIE